MKKIAFIAINETAPWGGSEELWSRTAMRMAQSGYEVRVSVKGWAAKPEQMQALERVCPVTYRRYEQGLIQKALFIVQRGKNLYRWLDRVRPDLAVIAQAANCDGLLWMEACLQRNIPYVVVSQAAAENHWIPDSGALRLAQALGQAKQCFFVSQKNVDLTVKQVGAAIPNASVVRNPYNVAFDDPPAWLPTDQGFKLACVGRIHPTSKGQDLILEVLRSSKWQNRALSVTFFGRGEHQDSLQRLSALWNIQNVEFQGFVPDVPSIWANHHALILPSRYEGLPLVVVEAMLCGRTCIVTDVAGNTELVDDNLNGFVAKAPIADCLDEALERAWQQREQWYELGKAAAAKARRVVPADPIAVFTQKLADLLD